MRDEFRRLFNDLPIGATVLTSDQEILYANPAFADYLGYSKDELEGQSILALTKSYDRDKLQQGLEELYNNDRKYLEMETCYLRQDGETVWGYPVRMLHPNPAAEEQDTILMMVVDITERRRLEEQLRHTERMSAMGMLAGSIAHDFNNVLTVVSTFVGLLEARPDDPEIIKEGIDKIRTASERGQELTKQLLEFGRRESSSIEAIDINHFLHDIKAMFDRVLPANISLELNLSDQKPTVVTDQGRLHQVLMNLVINSRDAIDNGGTITVETTSVSADPDQRQAIAGTDALGEGKFTRIRICDTGPGISSELVPRIFEPYFTTKGNKGTGLGLTTVYGIVEEDKGYIRVDSREGEGTCFDIFLPASHRARRSDDTPTGSSRLTM